MNKVEAVIRPEKLDSVRQALESMGCPGMMVTEIKGQGRQRGIELEWRVGVYKVRLLPKVKVEVVIEKERLQSIIETIAHHAYTGEVGDGKIFVSAVEDVVRIRTKENGHVAL